MDVLFDRLLLAQRRRRVAAARGEHDFLARRANEDLVSRLGAVTREFTSALILGSQSEQCDRQIVDAVSSGMLVFADPCPELLSSDDLHRIACEEELLPFAPASFDLVISPLTLHMVNDVPGVLLQIRRSLKPDGLLLAAALGGRTLNELRECLTAAESELEGGASPRVIPFADVRDFGGLLQRAGFALPVTDADLVTVTYASLFDLMRDLRGMGAANILNDRTRKPLRRETLFRAAEIYAERFPAGDGRISATFEIIHLSGWAPDESQQKPLRPGSARSRLADALGTKEQPAGEKANPKGRA